MKRSNTQYADKRQNIEGKSTKYNKLKSYKKKTLLSEVTYVYAVQKM